jgi:hypothetical protein
MPYFQGTALTHTKKIPPLFQGLVDNEKESGFRWLLEQVHLLLRECKVDDTTLQSLDDDDLNRRSTRGQKRRSGPASSAPAAFIGIPSSTRQPAKRQRTGGRQTVNRLPSVDLTADNVDDGDVGDGVNTKETQSSIYCGGTGEEVDYPSDFSSDVEVNFVAEHT